MSSTDLEFTIHDDLKVFKPSLGVAKLVVGRKKISLTFFQFLSSYVIKGI